MSHITTTQIEQDPADFLRRVEAGESLMIVRGGRPVAEIRPIESTPKPRPRFGSCAGEFTVPDDFDDPLPEDILRDFEGQRPYGLCAGEFTVPHDFDHPLPEETLRDFEGR